MVRFGRLLLVVGILTWLALPALAQFPQQRGRPQQPRLPETPISSKGTIQAVNAGPAGVMIEVATEENNQTWLLQVGPNAKVKVSGKGNASSLVKGQNVSFSANANGKKEVISKLAVVLPGGGQTGMMPSGGPGPAAKPAKPGKKPAGAEAAGAEAGGLSEGTGVVVRAPKSAAISMIQLMVNGKKRMYELPEDVEVTFDMEGPAALEFVGPGAKIEFKGKRQGQYFRAVVENVTVEVVPAEAHAGKKLVKKPLHAKSKKGGDDSLDAPADDEKPEAKKPHHHAKKPDAGDESPADAKPADAGDAAAKDK